MGVSRRGTHGPGTGPDQHLCDEERTAYTYAAAGRLLGNSASSVARLVIEQKLDVIGKGSGRRVTAESLHRYVEEEVTQRGRAS